VRSKARIVELLAEDYDRSRHSTNIIACFEFGESSYSIHFGSLKEPFCSHNYRISDHTAYELNWTVESLCYLMAGNLDGRVNVPSKYGLLGKTTMLLPALRVSLGRTAGADGSLDVSLEGEAGDVGSSSSIEFVCRAVTRRGKRLVEIMLCSSKGFVAGRFNLETIGNIIDALSAETNKIILRNGNSDGSPSDPEIKHGN